MPHQRKWFLGRSADHRTCAAVALHFAKSGGRDLVSLPYQVIGMPEVFA